MEKDCKQLIDHISRMQGQLNSIKAELQKGQIDCAKASQTLLATSRSFATLRMNFIQTFLRQKFRLKNTDQEMYKQLLSLIKG